MAQLFDTLRARSQELFAAIKPTPTELPKGKAGQRSFPAHLTSTKPAETPLQKTDRRVANKDLTSYRTGATTKAIIRDLSLVNPDLSAAVSAYLRTGIPDNYTVVSYNPDGTFNREGTAFCQQMLSRINTGQNYLDGFSGWWSIRSLCEALGRELMVEGAASMELVLDKTLMPAYFAPVAVSTISFIPDKSSQFKFLRPIQKLGAEEIDLDVPTFFYVTLDPLLTDATSNSPLESAVQPALFSLDFMNDIRRVVRKAIHPRLDIEIDVEALQKMAPPDAHHDPDKMRSFESEMLDLVRNMVNDLEPEEALVRLSFVKPTMLDRGNTSLDREYEVLSGMADAKLATGAKVLPSVLGHGTGSQNIASAESLMFMKNANGTIRMKLNELLSRAFTLAAKLAGFDVTVEFLFDAIDLRPDSELEAFKATKQSRILELLSIGYITDEEACLRLTGSLPPLGFVPLAGTMFRASGNGGGSNPYSGTSQGGGQSGGGALNQQLKPNISPKPAGQPKSI